MKVRLEQDYCERLIVTVKETDSFWEVEFTGVINNDIDNFWKIYHKDNFPRIADLDQEIQYEVNERYTCIIQYEFR
jgi:hypothetical protein